jgi:hypothetical protein
LAVSAPRGLLSRWIVEKSANPLLWLYQERYGQVKSSINLIYRDLKGMKIKLIHKFLIGILLLIIIWFIPLPDMIALRIGLNNSFKNEAVGILGRKPLQYKRFELLNTFSSTRTLKRLYHNHRSPAVKSYSFFALRDRVDSDELFDLLKEGIYDDRELTVQFGCIIGGSMVADLLIDFSRDYLTDKHNSELDSLLLYSDICSHSQNLLLRTMNPNTNHYPRIKELAAIKMKPEALISLAKFRQEEDILIIKQQLNNPNIDLYYPLLAVKHFPAEDFIPDILKIQKEKIRKFGDINYLAIRALYKALVRFDCSIIESKLKELISLDIAVQKIIQLPEKERNFENIVSDFFMIDTNPPYVIYGPYYTNEQIIRIHLRALMLALFDYPTSHYNFLLNEIALDQTEMLFLEMELEQTRYE